MAKNILYGKNCFLTGATGGLGKQIAIELAKNNCNLFLTSQNKLKLEQLKNKLSENFKNIKIFYKDANLNKLSEIEKLILNTNKTFEKVDILINCAGIFQTKSLQNSSVEDFDSCFNVNVRAPFILSKEFSKNMKKNNFGRIINIGSSSAYYGFKNTSIYCASKHALLGFSRSIFTELKKNNVRVYAVSPGSIKTKMGKKVKGENYDTFLNPEEIAKFISHIISFDNEMVSEEIRLNRI